MSFPIRLCRVDKLSNPDYILRHAIRSWVHNFLQYPFGHRHRYLKSEMSSSSMRIAFPAMWKRELVHFPCTVFFDFSNLNQIPRLARFVSARFLVHIEFFNQNYVLYLGFFVNAQPSPSSPSGNVRECTTFSNFPFISLSSFELLQQEKHSIEV